MGELHIRHSAKMNPPTDVSGEGVKVGGGQGHLPSKGPVQFIVSGTALALTTTACNGSAPAVESTTDLEDLNLSAEQVAAIQSELGSPDVRFFPSSGNLPLGSPVQVCVGLSQTDETAHLLGVSAVANSLGIKLPNPDIIPQVSGVTMDGAVISLVQVALPDQAPGEQCFDLGIVGSGTLQVNAENCLNASSQGEPICGEPSPDGLVQISVDVPMPPEPPQIDDVALGETIVDPTRVVLDGNRSNEMSPACATIEGVLSPVQSAEVTLDDGGLGLDIIPVDGQEGPIALTVSMAPLDGQGGCDEGARDAALITGEVDTKETICIQTGIVGEGAAALTCDGQGRIIPTDGGDRVVIEDGTAILPIDGSIRTRGFTTIDNHGNENSGETTAALPTTCLQGEGADGAQFDAASNTVNFPVLCNGMGDIVLEDGTRISIGADTHMAIIPISISDPDGRVAGEVQFSGQNTAFEAFMRSLPPPTLTAIHVAIQDATRVLDATCAETPGGDPCSVTRTVDNQAESSGVNELGVALFTDRPEPGDTGRTSFVQACGILGNCSEQLSVLEPGYSPFAGVTVQVVSQQPNDHGGRTINILLIHPDPQHNLALDITQSQGSQPAPWQDTHIFGQPLSEILLWIRTQTKDITGNNDQVICHLASVAQDRSQSTVTCDTPWLENKATITLTMYDDAGHPAQFVAEAQAPDVDPLLQKVVEVSAEVGIIGLGLFNTTVATALGVAIYERKQKKEYPPKLKAAIDELQVGHIPPDKLLRIREGLNSKHLTPGQKKEYGSTFGNKVRLSKALALVNPAFQHVPEQKIRRATKGKERKKSIKLDYAESLTILINMLRTKDTEAHKGLVIQTMVQVLEKIHTDVDRFMDSGKVRGSLSVKQEMNKRRLRECIHLLLNPENVILFQIDGITYPRFTRERLLEVLSFL